jgi:nicotinamidase-related amidase
MTAALLIIDIQNDYFPGGAMALHEPEAAAANAARLIAAFRQRGRPVVHMQHVSTRPGATFFLSNTPGVEIHAAVRPLPAANVQAAYMAGLNGLFAKVVPAADLC